MARKVDGKTAVTVSLDAAEELRAYAARAGGQLGERVTLDDALRLAVAIAARADEQTTRAVHDGRA